MQNTYFFFFRRDLKLTYCAKNVCATNYETNQQNAFIHPECVYYFVLTPIARNYKAKKIINIIKHN